VITIPVQPLLAKSIAIPAPMPHEPPVITETLPARGAGIDVAIARKISFPLFASHHHHHVITHPAPEK